MLKIRLSLAREGPCVQVGSGGQALGRAQIAPEVFIGAEAENFLSLSCEPQVGGNDGKDTFFRQQRKNTRREHVDAAESQGKALGRGADNLRCILFRFSPAQQVGIIKQQLPRACTLLNGQRRQSVAFDVALNHSLEVDIADDVDIVHQEWPIGAVLKETDILISSVPSQVIGETELAVVPKHALLVDLAAPPGGIDRDAAAKFGLRFVWARGLGSRAPITVGRSQWSGIRRRIEEIVSTR